MAYTIPKGATIWDVLEIASASKASPLELRRLKADLTKDGLPGSSTHKSLIDALTVARSEKTTIGELQAELSRVVDDIASTSSLQRYSFPSYVATAVYNVLDDSKSVVDTFVYAHTINNLMGGVAWFADEAILRGFFHGDYRTKETLL